MAETAVFGALCKIGVSLASSAAQASRSEKIENIIYQIKDELELMQAFLRQSQQRESYSEPTEVYLEKVRRLSFEIEDIMDEYMHLFDGEESGFLGSLLNFFGKSMKVYSWYKIGNKLKDMQIRLQNLRHLRAQYSIKLTGESSTSIDTMEDNNCPFFSYQCDEPLGITEEKAKLTEWLTTDIASTTVSTVCGMGGSGKTTLVKYACEQEIIKEHFDCQIWVTVSQNYKVDDIMRKMIKNASKDTCAANLDGSKGGNLIKHLQDTLKNKKFVLILDDVWSEHIWICLKPVLYTEYNGSRVVITTRLRSVASSATKGQALEVPKLDEASSWELFCRWAFRHGEDKKCPQDIEPLARKMLARCEGLPLAIVTVSNLMSFRRTDVQEWTNLYSQLNWELDINIHGNILNNVAKILMLSYKHLPSHLKNCVMFCSTFPEDYLIPRKRLIRLWVAEGLIEPIRNKTLEDTAEYYLNELVDRCLLQVAKWNEFGRVKQCQMHDVVRDLVVQISQREKFCMNFRNPQATLAGVEPRRLSMHECSGNINIQSGLSISHLRSYYQFDKLEPSSCISWVSSGAKYLKVLELENAAITSLPKDVANLFNLNYLGLRRTKIKALPSSMDKLQNLQTLDIYHTKMQVLPSWITKLNRLRHLVAGNAADLSFEAFLDWKGLETPKGLWGLAELRTLKGISASTDLVCRLENMPQLRTLQIDHIASFIDFFRCISKLEFLQNLTVSAANEFYYINLEALERPPLHLCKLSLTGRLHDNVLESTLFQAIGENLRRLSLRNSRLKRNPLVAICRMSNLTFLGLDNAFIGEELLFQEGWFKKLHTLSLARLPCVKSITIQQQAMENLQVLVLLSLPLLGRLPRGIEFLTSLRDLLVTDVHEQFLEDIRPTETTASASGSSPSISSYDASHNVQSMPTAHFLQSTPVADHVRIAPNNFYDGGFSDSDTAMPQIIHKTHYSSSPPFTQRAPSTSADTRFSSIAES